MEKPLIGCLKSSTLFCILISKITVIKSFNIDFFNVWDLLGKGLLHHKG